MRCSMFLLFVCFSSWVTANASQGVTTYKSVSAIELMSLHEKTKIIVVGFVIDQIKKNKYQIRDDTGSLTIIISPSVLGSLTLLRHDKVEVRGEVDDAITGKFVVAHSLRKLKK